MIKCLKARKITEKAKRFLQYKTRAGVLIYALVISMLTLIFLISFLQLFLISNKEKIMLMSEDKKEDILQSGIEFLLSANVNSPDTIFKVLLFENDEHEHYLKQERFGLFDIITSSLIWGNDTLYKTVMIANCQKTNQTALILNPGPFAQKIGGEALLEGDIEISGKGIERAYVGGKNYTRDSLVYGNVIRSDHPIPRLEYDILMMNNSNFANFSFAEIMIYSNNMKLIQKRGFHQRTLVIKSKDEIIIHSDSISGKCIIQSEKAITVGKNACLNDIILSAPKIILEENFEGCLQAIASDTIIIGKNVKLRYPSAVFICQAESSAINPLIEVGDSAVVKGLIIAIQSKKGLQKQMISPVITIGMSSEIIGQVYCTGSVYHRGLIKGSLVCKQLIDLSSGVNESLLIDGKISKRKMPAYFPEFSITGNNHQRTILKCLE